MSNTCIEWFLVRCIVVVCVWMYKRKRKNNSKILKKKKCLQQLQNFPLTVDLYSFLFGVRKREEGPSLLNASKIILIHVRSFFWLVCFPTHFKITVQKFRTVRNTNPLGSLSVRRFIPLFPTGVNTDCTSLLIHCQMNRRKHYSFSIIISTRGLCCKQSPPMFSQGVLV